MSRGEVRIFSRTRDEITESFPELPPAFASLPKDAILDGEIVAWNRGDQLVFRREPPCPSASLQQRLGRKESQRASSCAASPSPISSSTFSTRTARCL